MASSSPEVPRQILGMSQPAHLLVQVWLPLRMANQAPLAMEVHPCLPALGSLYPHHVNTPPNTKQGLGFRV
jgi:hypothetical protein